MIKIEINPTLLSRKEQVAKLNTEVKCTIKPSNIEGIGVFALRDIDRGERCYISVNTDRTWFTLNQSALNELRPEIRELILSRWASIINGGCFQSPNDDVWLALFVNHSDDPNYDQTTDTALKDIKAGEEIFESYKIMSNAKEVYKFLN